MTTHMTLLRLERLTLRNFRCFESGTIDLHPKLTVLVAENSRGKTALLEALAAALGFVVDTLVGETHYSAIEPEAIRQKLSSDRLMVAAQETEIEANALFQDTSFQWKLTRKLDSPRTGKPTSNSKIAVLLKNVREHSLSQGEGDETPLPLIASYRARRLLNTESYSVRDFRASPSRMDGYIGCLDASASIQDLTEWYADVMRMVGNVLFPDDNPTELLRAVDQAMQVVLAPTQWSTLRFSKSTRTLTLEHPLQGEIPVNMLSSGVRTMMALVMDIARRCALLNPHFGVDAAHKTPGVLLIDEVDLHLHPGWQQQVIGLLQEAFPLLQIVVSTHSPHVLSTVDKESIRLIELNSGEAKFKTPNYQTRGVESADVLAKIMGVDPVPQVAEAAWLSEYRAYVQNGDDETESAQRLWLKLREHFGEDHPVIDGLETLRRLQVFKRSRQLS